MTTLELIKMQHYIWVYDALADIKNISTHDLFERSSTEFTNGWGDHWSYADQNVTWSFDPITLYQRYYPKAREKMVRMEEIDGLMKTNLSAEMKEKIIKAYLYGFYGDMYGGPAKDKDRVIPIRLGTGMDYISNEGELIYVWGMPGPDYNRYKPSDYSITWALTPEELGFTKEELEDK